MEEILDKLKEVEEILEVLALEDPMLPNDALVALREAKDLLAQYRD